MEKMAKTVKKVTIVIFDRLTVRKGLVKNPLSRDSTDHGRIKRANPQPAKYIRPDIALVSV